MLARIFAAAVAMYLVVSLVGSARAAEGGADPVRAEARERYERGKQLYEEHDYAGALAEFMRAQQLIPSPVTLLNIGRVYAAMGRPVDAVVALDKVLAAPGALRPEQVELATRTRNEQRKRVARLSVTTNVPATIEIDGLPIGRTPLSEPLRVAGGAHIVTALAPGYLPARKEITVAGEASASLKFDLDPSDAKGAHLTLKTALPDAEVVIDGQVVARTPLPSSLTVIPGRRVVELRRPGYVPARKEISLGDGASGTLAFELEEDPHAATEGWGYLTLAISEDEAEVTVDGHPRGVYRKSLRLPPGAHTLRVERGGFEPLERITDVRPRAETLVRVTLQPTPDTRVAYLDRTRRQRTWGWTTASVGAGIAGVATVFVLLNESKLDTAKKDRAAIDMLFVPGSNLECDPKGQQKPDCDQRRDDAYEKVNDLNLRRTIGLVALGVGAAALVTGTVLILINDNPHKYDRVESGEMALTPVGWFDRDGGLVGVRARF
jgi:hypothetical protein